MKTAFSAFVFGSYEKFIPFYSYSIQQNYPESDVVIFYLGTVSPTVKAACKVSKNVKIYELDKHDFPDFSTYAIRGGGLKLMRHLMDASYFDSYQYVYFGDVDILILDEGYSLFDFHKKQIETQGVPFSNKVRLFSDGSLTERLTGLHFVETKPYFDAVDPVAKKILSNATFRNSFLNGLIRDEQFLYHLNKEAFNFNPKALSNNKRPWHGFHLGLVRGKKSLNETAIKENSSLPKEAIQKQLQAFRDDVIFMSLFKKVHCPELYYTFVYFGISLPPYVHLTFNFKAWRLRWSRKLKSKLKHKRIIA